MALLGLAGVWPAMAQQQNEPLSAIAEAAGQRGIRTCLPSIDRLAKNLAASYSIGVYLFNRLEEPDSNLVSISMELTPSPSGGAFYMSATFVPVGNGGCQVMLETTMHWASGCVPVGLAYPGLQVAGRLLNDITIMAAQGTERLFLMPVASGCVSIEKSIIF